MNSVFVLDTNFILDYLKGLSFATQFLAGKVGAQLIASDITRLELLSFALLSDTEKSRIEDFLEHVEILPVTPDIGDIAIAFRRATRRKLPDSIIAATAIHLEADLVTRDKELLGTSYQGFSAIYP